MSLSDIEKRDRLRLIRSDNVGPITYRQLVKRFGSATEALAALPDLAAKGGRKRKIKLFPIDAAEREITNTHEAGAQFLFLETNNYPSQLAALPDAPPVLIIKGNAKILSEPSVGIVGARNASAAGMKFTQTVARDLGEAGYAIASGLARGIDTAAHKGSLATGTIAVMAGGIDVIYPPENQNLHDQIAEQGAILCELPIGTRPLARHFPQRNRLISGLAKGVLVVEAALRSGSLITARNAAEQGREVFSVPGSPLDPRHRGTNDLLRQGATLVESAEDITEVLGGMMFNRTRDPEPELDLAPPIENSPDDQGRARQIVEEKMSATPIDVDELIRQCDLTPALVLTILLELELAGRLERHVGNRVALV